MEQLVILVIIGLISLVNWLMQRSAELREKRKQERKTLGIPEGNPFQPSPDEEPEDQPDPAANIRRLMEALGLPMESEPPLSEQRTEIQLPDLPPPPPVPVRAKPASRPTRSQQAPAAPPAPASALSLALKQRGNLRQAIILREILGPPKGLAN